MLALHVYKNFLKGRSLLQVVASGGLPPFA